MSVIKHILDAVWIFFFMWNVYRGVLFDGICYKTGFKKGKIMDKRIDPNLAIVQQLLVNVLCIGKMLPSNIFIKQNWAKFVCGINWYVFHH